MCTFGVACRYAHAGAEEAAAEFAAKGGKVTSVCKFGKKCREPAKCTNLHLAVAPRPKPSGPRGERKGGRNRKAPQETPALRDTREALRLLQKLCKAQEGLALSSKALKDPATQRVADGLQEKILALSAESGALLQAVKSCFGPTIPLPAADETSDDSASGDSPSAEEAA